MFILTSPILTIISILGLAFFYALVISAQKIEIIRKICLTASFAALFVGLLMGLSFDKSSVGYQYLASFNFVSEYNSAFALGADGLSYIFLVLTLITFPFLFLAAWTVTKFPKQFFCHLLAMELLLVLTFVTVDLFYFFILFESLLIPMFLLIGGWGARTRKIKAAYYFFLYTLFGSLFMLFGMIYLYQITGSLNYHVLLTETLKTEYQNLLWVCFFLAFAVKMPLFPFHIWLPEAHVEAPTVGSMLLASLLLKLGGYGLLRFSLTFLSSASVAFTAVVAMLAVAGVIYGSLSTMRQIDLKRIIAYSSVAHMNLVALGIFSSNRVGIEGAIYLMVAHGVVSTALFFCVGVIYDRAHTRLVRYYGGLVTVMPVFVTFFFFFNLANMGFPGTPNFVGETLLLIGIYDLSRTVVWPAVLGIVLGAAYTTKMFGQASFGALKTKYIARFIDVTRREVALLVALLLFFALLGARSDLLLAFLEATVWHIVHFSESSHFAAEFSPLYLILFIVMTLFAPHYPFWLPVTMTGLVDALSIDVLVLLIVLVMVDLSYKYAEALVRHHFAASTPHEACWMLFLVTCSRVPTTAALFVMVFQEFYREQRVPLPTPDYTQLEYAEGTAAAAAWCSWFDKDDLYGERLTWLGHGTFSLAMLSWAVWVFIYFNSGSMTAIFDRLLPPTRQSLIAVLLALYMVLPLYTHSLWRRTLPYKLVTQPRQPIRWVRRLFRARRKQHRKK